MANHKSSEKRARQTLVKTERNRFYKTRIKNITKDVLSAVESADKEKATVEHELFHKKTYSPAMIQAIIPACTYENAVNNCNASMDVHGFWWPLQTRYGKRNIQPRVEFLEFIVEELKRYK